jgi:hypothetical protein
MCLNIVGDLVKLASLAKDWFAEYLLCELCAHCFPHRSIRTPHQYYLYTVMLIQNTTTCLRFCKQLFSIFWFRHTRKQTTALVPLIIHTTPPCPHSTKPLIRCIPRVTYTSSPTPTGTLATIRIPGCTALAGSIASGSMASGYNVTCVWQAVNPHKRAVISRFFPD